MDDFLALWKFIGNMVSLERPSRILEISGDGNKYGHLLKIAQEHFEIPDGIVDRIVIPNSPANAGGTLYDRVLGEEYLEKPQLLERYDFILIMDLFEMIEPEKAREMLDALKYKVSKQILIITPLDSETGIRKYHPVVFMGLDFAFSMLPNFSKAMQVYNVFPKMGYSTMKIDQIPASETVEKMNIAFALPHHGITGGMKALLQQIRHLKRKGHNLHVYYRSNGVENAIPSWSDLTAEDYTKQVVIPSSHGFLENMQDADIIILGGVHQVPEFVSSRIPAVLWEQGAEAVFGEFGKALHSASSERLSHHALYSLPVHLLAVSDIIADFLKGIYGRDAFVYPNGVDTGIYYPAQKHNDTPIILLTGHPSLAFKGFRFAFNALSHAYAQGLRFKVKWAAQVKVIHGPVNFPLEIIVRPSQHELAEMYRSADIFLSTSLYESYSLPPLEAMASGTAVVATDCGGIRTYAENEKNCILCRQGDLIAVTNALARLINSQEERQRLALAGRETAIVHSAENMVGMLERRLSDIVQHGRRTQAAIVKN